MKIRCMNCMEEYESSENVISTCPFCHHRRGTDQMLLYALPAETVLSGRYIVGTVVSYGGFGIIYRAWDRRVGGMVAVKEYFPTEYLNRTPGEANVSIYESKDQEFESGLFSFIEEARGTAKFSTYDNIVNVIDFFRENGTAYMVMEFMEGHTLKAEIEEKGGRLPWEQAVAIGTAVMDILSVVHAENILHRDVNPNNIMICKNGQVKLFDFGAGRFPDSPGTNERKAILTVGYAPPEQYNDQGNQGPWTDIYALGATLYKAISGSTPTESQNREADFNDGLPDSLPQLSELCPEIPVYVNNAVMKAMAVQPDLRFRNAQEFKDAILGNVKTELPESVLRAKRIRRNLTVAGLIILLLAGFSACLSVFRKQQSESLDGDISVSVWVAGNEDRKAVFEAMTEEFRSDYPNITVEITAVDPASYQSEFSALSGGSLPVLFQTDAGGFSPPAELADLSSLYEELGTADYPVYAPLNASANKDMLPLGFRMSLVFANRQKGEAEEGFYEVNAPEEFIDGQSAVCVTDITDYSSIQENLPAIYLTGMPEGSKGILSFDQVFSVNGSAGSKEKRAAIRLLSYYAGQTAQDILHIQNVSSFPVEKTELEAYKDVYSEVSFACDAALAGNYTGPVSGTAIKASYQELYSSLFPDESTCYELIREWISRN